MSRSDANGNSSAGDAKQNPSSSPAAVVTCVCPPIAGVTCTLTGTTNTGSSVASAAGCPHVGYCSPTTNNSWSSAAGTGTLQYMFSSPVSAATLRANSVNTNDFATISASGGSGGALSISGVVCMGVSGLVIGPLTVAASYGGVSWTVNSTGSYTNVLLTNTGAQSGWVSACPTAITPVALPIELVSLKGTCTTNAINLEWRTSSEKNNSYFTIERSYNTENWEVIGQIPGAGNSSSPLNYTFVDSAPLTATAYYRLKQTDLDRVFKLSELISVDACNKVKGEIDVNIYPNPARNEVIVKTTAEDATLEIYNILGELCAVKKLNPGETKIDISGFNNGTYFFKTSNPGSTLKFTKIIVQN